AESLPMMLGVGLSGQPFTGTDIGGYSGGASPELFARWMALGVISPFMRGHFTSGVAGQEPWMFGPEVLAISRAFLQLRVRLLPYLEGLFDAAHVTGAPVLRPVAWHFPEHPPADDLALLGPWLLAAPVLAEGATDRPLDLPPGRWLDWWSGRVIQGPARITPSVRLAALPLFLREGAIVPTGPAARSAAEAAGPLTLELFPGPTPTRQTRVLDGGGEAVGHIEYVLSPRADGFSLSAAGDAPPAGPLHLRIRPLDQPPTAVTLDGLPVADVRHDPQDRSLWLTVPDVAAFTLVITGAAQGPEPAWVEVPFEVQVPEDTPRDRPVHIASSVDGWQVHHPLAWQADGTAAGTLRAPRGEWFDYKFSRGDWPTVEKWPDCEEADNRYGLAAAWPPRAEQVFAWRDRCEAP
ncbi:MAG: hypothetical protein KC613_22665, partial [Myxococcales bacterium]|nr:hypothetical protein [Myxococcales bacterium]